MSDVFPSDTWKVLSCQAALIIIPVSLILVAIGVIIGWLLWG